MNETDALDAASKVVVLFLVGDLPQECIKANLGARLIVLRKKNGTLRPVACGSVIRRLAARAACEEWKDEIQEACGTNQYAVPFGIAMGSGTRWKLLAAWTRAALLPRRSSLLA